MIWGTVSSWSCFCWLYRASLSLAGKNIINLISVLTIWWCPCVESSLAFLKEGVCYDQCVLLTKSLLAFALLILYSKAKFACYSRCFLTSYFCIPVPCGTSGKEPACQCRRHRDQVGSLVWEDPLKEGMATHSNILAWEIPLTEEPGRL